MACLEKLPHDCGSNNGLQVFVDDTGKVDGFCFSCGKYVEDPYGGKPAPEYKPKDPEDLRAQVLDLRQYPCHDLPDRRLKKYALNYFGIRMEVGE